LRTGKVERRQFGTREEAEQYLAKTEEKLLAPKPNRRYPELPPRIPSLRDFRLEIQYRAPVQVQAEAPEQVRARAA
jgi:hypothetical protein